MRVFQNTGGKVCIFMSTAIVLKIESGSIAEEIGIEPGDKLLTVNGYEVRDILEYRYLISEYEVELEIEKKDGSIDRVIVENDYEDLGIEFSSGLIDDAQSCRNKCIFCFIDQLPKGMRETVYFKDDDTRLSFLQGNYVTLTNMSDSEIDRMIKMRVSPINISVHTTNPQLRERMLSNRFAGRVYEIMKKFASNNIYMNCQIVLCPDINDGDELDRSISDMEKLYPYVNSIAVVPVGLTRYRDGLYPLRQFSYDECKAVINQVGAHQQRIYKKHGTRLVYLSDEFYLNAKLPVPLPDEYEGFPQMDNGVGLVASMKEEIEAAVKMIKNKHNDRSVMLVTGEMAYPFIKEMTELVAKYSGIRADVYAVKNNFFGGGVNVAGLVCGGDIIDQIKDKPKCDELIMPSVMLRSGERVFLDDITVEDIEKALGMKTTFAENDGYDFVEKLTGEELEF